MVALSESTAPRHGKTKLPKVVCDAMRPGALVDSKKGSGKPGLLGGGAGYPLLETEFQGHSDILCSFGHYH